MTLTLNRLIRDKSNLRCSRILSKENLFSDKTMIAEFQNNNQESQAPQLFPIKKCLRIWGHFTTEQIHLMAKILSWDMQIPIVPQDLEYVVQVEQFFRFYLKNQGCIPIHAESFKTIKDQILAEAQLNAKEIELQQAHEKISPSDQKLNCSVYSLPVNKTIWYQYKYDSPFNHQRIALERLAVCNAISHELMVDMCQRNNWSVTCDELGWTVEGIAVSTWNTHLEEYIQQRLEHKKA